MKLVLLLNVATTLMMIGVIWIIQVVHYPLFSRVGIEAFTQYQAEHTSRITLVVMPLMVVEAITALLLVIQPPAQMPPTLFIIGLVLIGIIWGLTFFVHVPQHTQLSIGFDALNHQHLVRSNWVRTVLWSLRGVIMLWVTAQLLIHQ